MTEYRAGAATTTCATTFTASTPDLADRFTVGGLLDGQGYVRLLDHLGDDLAIVNAARASFMKESRRFKAEDERLLRFLVSRKELHPFRHGVLSFEVHAPLVAARQWWKYAVASSHVEDQLAWSEASRRYVTADPTFYVPEVWRSAPANRKQGSGGPVAPEVQAEADRRLRAHVVASLAHYEWALAAGIAPELARAYLPAYHLYVTWRWTASLAAVGHFLRERLEEKAQHELNVYAHAVKDLASKVFPVSIAGLTNAFP
jgi:thymidylate synthase (FAD)